MWTPKTMRRLNREAAQSAPKYNPKQDDWDTVVREQNTGRCARCDQYLPEIRQGINRRPIDEFGFRVIAI